MYMKLALIAASVLVAIQAKSTAGKEAGDANVEKTGYVEIDGETYYINTRLPMPYDDAERFCNNLNMTLVSFPTNEKWEAVKVILWPSEEYGDNYYWTGAMRDEGSKVWYWERSGEVIPFELLHWGRWQPTMNNNLIRSCITCIDSYQDRDCNAVHNFICEYL